MNVVDYTVRFTLEVLGVSGAIWGSSEAFGLRNENNNESWRIAAIAMGILALGRFAHGHWKNHKTEETELPVITPPVSDVEQPASS